jgi:hypothetical protein
VNDKRTLYRTARATIGCAKFNAGEFVSVQFSHYGHTANWYLVTGTESGLLADPVPYPEHFLSNFCL